MAYLMDKFKVVGIDGNFSGIFDTEVKWNGWLCPLFPLDVAKKIIRHQNLQDCIENQLSFYKISDYPKGIIEHHVDDVYLWKVKIIYGIEYYAIGSGNWTWELA